jgi:hypothetical protein
MAAIQGVAAALVLLVVLGMGYALIEIAGRTLLQRLVSEEVLGRAFSVVESAYWITTGLGAILAPAIVSVLGARGALVAVGACLPVIVLLRWNALARLEAGAEVPERPFRLLRSLSLFAPLPLATVENLARETSEVNVAAGTVVIAEGDVGEQFYAVEEGVLDVTSESGAGAPIALGGFFGEIALLRDVRRTATVTARSDAVLYSLDRDAFLCAVTGHTRSAEAATRVVEVRLGGAHVG